MTHIVLISAMGLISFEIEQKVDWQSRGSSEEEEIGYIARCLALCTVYA